MAQYIEVEIDDQVVRFEVDPRSISGEVAVSGASQKIKNLVPEMQRLIQGVGLLVFRAVSSLHEQPEETTIEFGINVKAEVGALVANSSTEAQIKVSLKWINDSDIAHE